jgi:hypothetical protein
MFLHSVVKRAFSLVLEKNYFSILRGTELHSASFYTKFNHSEYGGRVVPLKCPENPILPHFTEIQKTII